MITIDENPIPDYVSCNNKKFGCHNIIIGSNSQIHQESSRCCVIGVDSYIPEGAYKCNVFGNEVILSNQNNLTNCIYIGRADQKVYISGNNKFATEIIEMDNRFQSIVETINSTLLPFEKKEGMTIYLPNGDCYIDIVAKIQELETKINYIMTEKK